MPDVLTTAQLERMNRDPVDDPHILLVEFEEEHSGTVHRYCRNNEDIESDGETYLAATIEFGLPGHGAEIRPVSLMVSNVDRKAGRALLMSQERVMVRLMVIEASDPDTYLVDTLDLLAIESADIDAEAVEGQLASVIDFQSPVPFRRVTKDLFPGTGAS